MNSRGNKSVGKKARMEEKTSSLMSENTDSKTGRKKTNRLTTDRSSMASIMRRLTEATYVVKKSEGDSENDKNSHMSSLDLSASKIDVNQSTSRLPNKNSSSSK